MPSRREAMMAGAALAAALMTSAVDAAQAGSAPSMEWLSYGGDKASSKYSPLDQIGQDNFNSLRVPWVWRSAEEAITKTNPDVKTWVWESTPLMVGGILYVSTSL